MWCLFLSHGITKFGWQAWNFVLPLFLLHFRSVDDALLYPAIFGLCITLSKLTLSPMLGSLADSAPNRLTVIRLGIGAQILGCTGTTAVIAAAYYWGTTSEDGGGFVLSLPVFVFTCCSGIVETLGTALASSAVKKDWTPALF